MKKAFVIMMLLWTAWLLLVAAGSRLVKEFPQLPDTARITYYDVIQCPGDYPIFRLWYDLNSDPTAAERIDYFLHDNTLFAVQFFKDEEDDSIIYVLRPRGIIERFNSIAELKGEGPCEIAASVMLDHKL